MRPTRELIATYYRNIILIYNIQTACLKVLVQPADAAQTAVSKSTGQQAKNWHITACRLQPPPPPCSACSTSCALTLQALCGRLVSPRPFAGTCGLPRPFGRHRSTTPDRRFPFGIRHAGSARPAAAFFWAVFPRADDCWLSSCWQ